MLEQAALVLSFKRSDYRSNLAGNRIKWLILQGFKELVWGRRYGKVRESAKYTLCVDHRLSSKHFSVPFFNLKFSPP